MLVKRNRMLAAVLVCLGGLLLAACGPSATPTPGTDETAVEVELGEWFVRPSVDAVPTGGVRFDAANVGQLEHELVILRTDLAADALPMRAQDTSRVDEAASGELIGEIEPDELGPGEEASATLALEAGSYVLLCNLPGHYVNGMRTPLRVDP